MLIPLLGYNIILSIQLSVRASYNTEQSLDPCSCLRLETKFHTTK